MTIKSTLNAKLLIYEALGNFFGQGQRIKTYKKKHMYRSYTEFHRGITVFHRVTKKQKPIENYTTQLC